MNLSFFDQFASPSLLGIPLILISMTFPALLLPSLDNRWITVVVRVFVLSVLCMYLFLVLYSFL